MEDLTRETLRAELNGLELRLVDRISTALALKADSSVVQQHDQRIQSLEQSRAARDHLAGDMTDLERRIVPMERFRYAVPGAAFLSALVATVALLLSIHPLG
jgi:hypothetical protein